jgi:drug/metabolite transporter (DMT)-like permease
MPLFVAWGRVAIASIALALVDVSTLRSTLATLSGKRALGIAGAGVLLAAHFALFLVGLDRTSMPAAISLVSLEPLSVVLCAWLLHSVRPTRGEMIGVAIATLGAVVVASTGEKGEHRLAGDLLVIAAVVLYGLYVAAARGLRKEIPARAYAALVYGSAAVGLAFVPIVSPGAWSGAASLPPHAWCAIVALAAIPTVIGHTAVQAAARDLSPSIVALVSPGETVGGIAIAMAMGDPPTLQVAIGAVIVIAGAATAILGARARRTPELPAERIFIPETTE